MAKMGNGSTYVLPPINIECLLGIECSPRQFYLTMKFSIKKMKNIRLSETPSSSMTALFLFFYVSFFFISFSFP